MERLNYAYPLPVVVGMVLKSLSEDFEGFVRNYNMHSMEKTIVELHVMRRTFPRNLKLPKFLCSKGERSRNEYNRIRLRARMMGKAKPSKLLVPSNPR